MTRIKSKSKKKNLCKKVFFEPVMHFSKQANEHVFEAWNGTAFQECTAPAAHDDGPRCRNRGRLPPGGSNGSFRAPNPESTTAEVIRIRDAPSFLRSEDQNKFMKPG